jgi:L-asparaginase II
MAYENFTPVLEVTRGPIVESVHFGAVAVVDSNGRLVASCGDPDTVTYLRSSAKPFQALPLVELGGPEHFQMTAREIAVTCASHSGTDEHMKVIGGLQAKINIREEDLQCGTHEPLHKATAAAMALRGERPTNNRNNCSGKHTGMLAQARFRGLPIDDYLNPSHPVQQLDLQTFAEMCSVPVESVIIGIDGCTAPVWAVPLRAAALAYARLADPTGLSEERAAACRKITHAMSSNPDMVAGPDRFDTELMELCHGTLVAKGGAEGYQGIAVLPGAFGPGSPGLGITLKISDGGAAGRACEITALETLRQIGVLTAAQIASLPHFGTRTVKNHRGIVVGEMRPCFKLNFA